jgi:hypothetical protein
MILKDEYRALSRQRAAFQRDSAFLFTLFMTKKINLTHGKKRLFGTTNFFYINQKISALGKPEYIQTLGKTYMNKDPTRTTKWLLEPLERAR